MAGRIADLVSESLANRDHQTLETITAAIEAAIVETRESALRMGVNLVLYALGQVVS